MAQHFDYNSLSDEDYFPSWNNLPVFTLMHICFLAEIQQCDGFIRYRTLVKDSDGQVRVVAFYPDSYEGFDFGQLKRGHTLAIMNARQHQFADGTYGVRVENMDDVCVGLKSLKRTKMNRNETKERTRSRSDAGKLTDGESGLSCRSPRTASTQFRGGNIRCGRRERAVEVPWLQHRQAARADESLWAVQDLCLLQQGIRRLPNLSRVV